MQFDDLGAASQLFIDQLSQSPKWLLMLAIGLMPVNLFFEMKKWRLLIHTIYITQWKETIQAILAGLTMALLTPNRVGEIFSRVFILPKEKRLSGVGLSAVGSLGQMVIIQSFGILGLLLIFKHPDFLLLSKSKLILLSILGLK